MYYRTEYRGHGHDLRRSTIDEKNGSNDISLHLLPRESLRKIPNRGHDFVQIFHEDNMATPSLDQFQFEVLKYNFNASYAIFPGR